MAPTETLKTHVAHGYGSRDLVAATMLKHAGGTPKSPATNASPASTATCDGSEIKPDQRTSA